MQRALEGLPGVDQVQFDERTDTFQVVASSSVTKAMLRQAVLGQVLFPRVRWLLGRLPGTMGAVAALWVRWTASTAASGER